jgi:hypothetical protein
MRQKRDKAGQPNPTADDDHQEIPRDENGAPIFLILPAPVRARYERRLAACEAGWLAGEVFAAAEAIGWVHIYRQPVPKWLWDAVTELAINRRTKAQASRYEEAQKDWARYSLVRDLKLGIPGIYKPIAEISWDDAYAEAARVLKGTFAKGSENTMKSKYAAVKNDLKNGRHGKYFPLKDERAAGQHARQMQDRRRRRSRATRKARRLA